MRTPGGTGLTKEDGWRLRYTRGTMDSIAPGCGCGFSSSFVSTYVLCQFPKGYFLFLVYAGSTTEIVIETGWRVVVNGSEEKVYTLGIWYIHSSK